MIGVAFVSVIYPCGVVFFGRCQESFDYGNQLCGGSCYQLDPALSTFDLLFAILLPLLLIIFCNCLLIFRVIYQKRRMLQRDMWRKNIRLVTQLLLVSVLHASVWMPVAIVIFITLFDSSAPPIVLDLQASFVLFNLVYISVLGNPVVSVFAIPEIKAKISELTRRWKPGILIRRIEPLAITPPKQVQTLL